MRGSQSVENMRAALMDLLGKGGRQFQKFDDAYAKAVRDRIMVPAQSGFFSAPRNIFGAYAGSPVTHGPGPVKLDDGTERMPQGFVENVFSYK